MIETSGGDYDHIANLCVSVDFSLAAAGGLFYTGSFDEMALHFFDFVSATLVATEFVAVLPLWMNHHFAPKTYSAARLAGIAKRRKMTNVRSARNIHGGFSNVT